MKRGTGCAGGEFSSAGLCIGRVASANHRTRQFDGAVFGKPALNEAEAEPSPPPLRRMMLTRTPLLLLALCLGACAARGAAVPEGGAAQTERLRDNAPPKKSLSSSAYGEKTVCR